MHQGFDFNIEVLKELDYVRITIAIEDKDVAAADFTADQIENMIELLASCRRTLSDKVPMTLEPVARLREVEDPVLVVSQNKQGDPVLCIRDPAFGWSSVRLEQPLAGELGKLLLDTSL